MSCMNYAEIEDNKLTLFFSKDFIDRGIRHGTEKGINTEALRILSDPRGRMVFADYILQGKYKIAPPRVCLIPKDNGEYRKVYANEDFDRLVLSIINDIYASLYKSKIHKCCVSYQKGIGVRDIIQKISRQITSEYNYGYKVDLSKYFDSVNKDTLYPILSELSSGSVIDKIVYDYYADDRVIDESGKVIAKYKSLAQGCSLGAFLANYALRDIDDVLSKMNILYYRYSDDLLILGKDAELALATLTDMLTPKGLELNPKKIKIINAEEPFEFLGIQICGEKVTFSNESIQRFKKKILEITKGKKSFSRADQRKAIKEINKYLYIDYLKSKQNFGWFEYFSGICNQKEDYRKLDEFVKDHLKAIYTGKWNHTRNMKLTSNDTLKEMGYISMVHMFNLFKLNKEVYNTELRSLL